MVIYNYKYLIEDILLLKYLFYIKYYNIIIKASFINYYISNTFSEL